MKIVIFLENNINDSPNFDEIISNNPRNSCERDSAEFSGFTEFFDYVKKVETNDKNRKRPKLTMQIIFFIDSPIMEFSISDFATPTFTSNYFLERAYQIIIVKVYVHYSHVTGGIHGNAHNFSNCKVREDQIGFSCLEHIFMVLIFNF